jgi:hypothetical protein
MRLARILVRADRASKAMVANAQNADRARPIMSRDSRISLGRNETAMRMFAPTPWRSASQMSSCG